MAMKPMFEPPRKHPERDYAPDCFLNKVVELTVDGEKVSKTVREWCDERGVKHATAYARKRTGFDWEGTLDGTNLRQKRIQQVKNSGWLDKKGKRNDRDTD